MARPINPDDPGGPSDPGGGGDPPPIDPGTALALAVTTTAITITSDQIAAAGGPWPAFTVRVTAYNDRGHGTAVSTHYPAA